MLKLKENFCGIAEGPAFGDCTKGPIFFPGTIIRPLAGNIRLECWSVEVLECWSIGVLECWSIGVMEKALPDMQRGP
jgi:hypothetical protein